MVYIVFLKEQSLWVEECPRSDVFELARALDAGICGVLTDRSRAQALMSRLKAEQERLWKRPAYH